MLLSSTKSRLLFFCLLFISSLSFSQVTTTLDADGPGDTYELINSVFGGGAASEVPDLSTNCTPPQPANHTGVRHISEAWDSTLNKYVFLFDAHVENGIIDYDRCANYDRQRNEIKTVSPSSITGDPGETHIYKWKFKMDKDLQASPNFFHLFQIKATGGGDDGAPLITITPRHYSDGSQYLQLIFTPSTGNGSGGTVAQVPLIPLKGQWLDVTSKVIYSDNGKYELTIKTLDGTVVMYYSSYLIDMYRANANFHRGKWGIYRSLNSISYLRDETVAFADFVIIEGEVNTVPSAPMNLTATVISDRQIDLSWQANADTLTNYLIQRSVDGSYWTTVAGVPASETSYSDKGLTGGTKYIYRISAENWNVSSAYTANVEATTATANNLLSPGWQSKDIGITTPAGSAADTSGVFDIEGAGSDVYGSADHFHYVYQTLSGDGIITARVDSIQNTNEWAKTGVMIRETLDINSPHAVCIITPVAVHTNGQGGIALQYRLLKGGSSSSIEGGAFTAPYWLRLSRKGNVFTGYQSADGITWDSVGTITIPMATTVYTGLMLTSHNAAVLGKAALSNVSVTTDSTGDPHIWLEAEDATITAPMVVKENYETSAGRYIVTETGKNTSSAPTDGHAVYNFNVTTAGEYKIWIRANAPNTDDDSFWFKMDNNDWFPMNEVLKGIEGWWWDEIQNTALAEKPIVKYNLAEGSHTFTVAYREDGAMIDKILITRDSTFNPNPATAPVSVAKDEKVIPDGYVLFNSYPNPFNPTTKISYQIPKSENVKLIVYDVMGREVATLIDEFQNSGKYEVSWNAANSEYGSLASGVYLARLQAGSFIKVIKLVLMK